MAGAARTLRNRAHRAARAWRGHAARRSFSPACVALADVLWWCTMRSLAADGLGGRTAASPEESERKLPDTVLAVCYRPGWRQQGSAVQALVHTLDLEHRIRSSAPSEHCQRQQHMRRATLRTHCGVIGLSPVLCSRRHDGRSQGRGRLSSPC